MVNDEQVGCRDSASSWSSSASRSSPAGGYTFLKTQEGAKALQAFSAAQNVKLTYNDQGQLADRGKTEGAAAIMSLLTNDWGYTVDTAELNPNDPLVNTASEYMYQMATIAHHTLDSATDGRPSRRTSRPSTARSTKAGTYEFTDRRQLLDRLRPDQPDRGRGSRQGLDRHGPRADRRARRRQRHRLGPPDGPRPRGPLRRHRRARSSSTGLGLVWATRPPRRSRPRPSARRSAPPDEPAIRGERRPRLGSDAGDDSDRSCHPPTLHRTARFPWDLAVRHVRARMP